MDSRGKALFVVTSQATLGEGGGATGLWLEELAPPFYILLEDGVEIDIASPAGGEAPIDPMCLDEPWISEDGRRFLKDDAAMQKVHNTIRLDDADGNAYRAIFLVGGAGAAWDFPENQVLGRLIQTINSSGGVVAGVCHGAVGLANNAGGSAFAKGRKVTCVSNEEEVAAGFDQLVPLFPQDSLGAAGAEVICAGPFEANVVVDGRLVTGQNPASARPLAHEIVKLLAS